jgi:hypothetical protein
VSNHPAGLVRPGFWYWIDVGLLMLSLSLSSCGGPVSLHATPVPLTPSTVAACCGDGHPPAGTGCCQPIKGAS